MNFKNQAYEDLVKDLLNDAFYIDQRSNRGKIATIRQYSEVVIRKLLDIPRKDEVTLGDYEIIRALKRIAPNNNLLTSSVKRIQKLGNKCTHTKNTSPITDENVSDAINSLFNLYAFFFIRHFEKYKFGSNNGVVSAFSILPPIVRYIVLNHLYTEDSNNLLVIDKLSLILLKAFDESNALAWIEERRGELENTLPYTPEAIAEIESVYGKLYADLLVSDAPENMYLLCLERIKEVARIIDKKGPRYNNFEQAKSLYLNKGILPEDTQEHHDFNDIMEFVYLGRKTEEREGS
ncbi:hypothetical protein [Klebsiella michiganensis]|uniref:hypothetical protein n=1 Tax=Klebsiella michiganensis TaxID=1134687 RepID=UPI0027F32F36|nr:hypothetical protein [Klebsiella michiganensis]MDQ7855509.1 hypothetical protein [Klebsiella michiganensis]